MKRIIIIMMFFCFFISSLFAINLHITEVFVDGSDEWVEITNFDSEEFVGSLSLSGVKSSLLTIPNVGIPSLSSLLIGDNLSMLSTYEGLHILSGYGLSLGDTSPIAISLSSDSNILDTFVVDQSVVQSYDNQMTSFHKQRNSTLFDIVPTISSLVWGVNLFTLAHPGRVYNSDGSIYGSPSSSGENNEDILPGSGSVEINDLLELCPSLIMDKVQIEEIYNGEEYGNYIEFISLVDYYGSLTFSGTVLSAPLTLPTQIRKANTRYIITNNFSGFHHDENIIVAYDRSLLSSGSLVIVDSELLPLDIGIIDTNGQSVYKSSSESCIGLFDQNISPSPGFDEQFLSYIDMDSESSPGECLTGDSDIIPPSTGGSGIPLNSGFQFNSGDVRISMIDYDPVGSDTNNERIGLTSFIGDVNLSGWTLAYDGKVYSFQSGIILSGQEYIKTANFVFVNSRSICVSLYYISMFVDVACYDPTVMSSPLLPLSGSQSEDSVSEEEDAINYNNLQFRILSVDYDPLGSDADNEKVTLQFIGGYSGVVLDNLRLRVGTSNKRIYGTLWSGQTITLIGNYQMPNSVLTCVALTYGEIIYDEYCYNPLQSMGNTVSSSSSNQSTEMYKDRIIKIVDLDYDPAGSDTDREILTLSMTGGQGLVDLSYMYIRFGTTKRFLKGILYSDTASPILGNYQLPNSKPTCVDLMEGNHIFDTYCYDPEEEFLSEYSSGDVSTGIIADLIGNMIIKHIEYDPPGKDVNQEMIVIQLSTGMKMLTGSLAIRFNDTTKSLGKNILLYDTIIFSGTYQLPNSKATCVELLYERITIDEYCYDPTIKEKDIIDRKLHYKGLQLDWILPNPKDKDIKNNNELFALSRSGGSGQTLTKDIKLLVGKTSISLSGYYFSSDQLVIPSAKALTNQSACVRLMIDGEEIDKICYPQTQEGLVYYHQRFEKGPQTLPSSLIDSLDAQGVDLSDLLLKKINKKICLTYKNVQIRCMNSGESATSQKNKSLLTLGNAYIRKVADMKYDNSLDRETLDRLSKSYELLAKEIKSGNLKTVNVYGTDIKVTELDRYIELASNPSADEYMLDQFSRILFGHQDVDRYYKNLY